MLGGFFFWVNNNIFRDSVFKYYINKYAAFYGLMTIYTELCGFTPFNGTLM